MLSRLTFFLGHNELEADKKAVVHLIVANHGNKGFRLFIYLLYRHITKSSPSPASLTAPVCF